LKSSLGRVAASELLMVIRTIFFRLDALIETSAQGSSKDRAVITCFQLLDSLCDTTFAHASVARLLLLPELAAQTGLSALYLNLDVPLGALVSYQIITLVHLCQGSTSASTSDSCAPFWESVLVSKLNTFMAAVLAKEAIKSRTVSSIAQAFQMFQLSSATINLRDLNGIVQTMVSLSEHIRQPAFEQSKGATSLREILQNTLTTVIGRFSRKSLIYNALTSVLIGWAASV
jgi:hypothetical protein